ARLKHTFGAIQAQKGPFYSGPLAPTWESSLHGVNGPGTLVMVPFNPWAGKSHQSMIDIARGVYDGKWKTYIQSCPRDRRILMVLCQEPDNDFTDGGMGGTAFTKAEYVNANNHLADVLHAEITAGRVGSNVEMWSCFQYTSIREGHWTDDRHPTHCDGISWDTYWNAPPGQKVNAAGALGKAATGPVAITGSQYEDSGQVNAKAYVANCKAIATRIKDQNGVSYANRRWGWGEIGIPYRRDDTNGTIRAATCKNMAVELIAGGALFGCLWNVVVGQYDHRWMDMTTTPKPAVTYPGLRQTVIPAAGAVEPAVTTLKAYFTA
ncbi:MAG: hypothetical protein M3140_11185, partial [Actinomycetota bacterium]|nr:hypothetical protein [Actinomycetota bacterium]